MWILWKSKKNKSIRILLYFFSLGLAWPALAEYKVERVQGKIRILKPLSADWEPLKDSFLPEGTLLSLEENARLSLKQTAQTQRGVPSSRLDIEGAYLIRLESSLWKKFELNETTLDGLWNENEKEVNQQPMLSFTAAFTRFLLRIDTAQEMPKLHQDIKRETVEAGQSAEEIPLLSPRPDSLFLLDKGEASIPVVWANLAIPGPFEVHLWPVDDLKRQAQLSTSGDHAILKGAEKGWYYLQVSSLTQAARSPKIRIQIDDGLRFRTKPDDLVNFFDKNRKLPHPALKLLYPSHGSLFLSSQKAKILFQWQDLPSLTAGEEYRLFIMKDKQSVLRKIANQDNSLQVLLEPGEYYAFVEKRHRFLTIPSLVSKSHYFQVKRARDSSYSQEVIHNWNQEKRLAKTIELE